MGLGRIALPTEAIDQLGEYVVGTRLPFNDRVSCAIGVWGDEPVISISLTQHASAPQRTTNGALLVTSGSKIRWAFEIDEPLGLIGLIGFASAGAALPWRRSATVFDGRTVQFIDVSLMVQELSGLSRRA